MIVTVLIFKNNKREKTLNVINEQKIFSTIVNCIILYTKNINMYDKINISQKINYFF